MTVLAAGLVISCVKENIDPVVEDSTAIKIEAPSFTDVGKTTYNLTTKGSGLTSKNSEVAIYMAEYITAGDSDEMGNTVFFKNTGNKQLTADFVPDLDLSIDGTTDISYYVDNNRPSADLPAAVTDAAIDRAMATWDGVDCSDLGIYEVPYDGSATGFVSAAFGFGGSFNYVADINHAGWLPGAFFDLLAPGGSNFILGVTFTLIFTSGGVPTDVDNNGKADVAFREIYYNDNFTWQDGATFDVETIALHEAGHGLSQAHFGKAFRTIANGKLHFSPRAVMNAAYSGVQTAIGKTDNGGHCSNWAQWPNN